MENVKSPQQIADEALPSTVLLEMEDSNGQRHGAVAGSSFERMRLRLIFMLLKVQTKAGQSCLDRMNGMRLKAIPPLMWITI